MDNDDHCFIIIIICFIVITLLNVFIIMTTFNVSQSVLCLKLIQYVQYNNMIVLFFFIS